MPNVTLTMPSSGALSFADLQRVFGQTNLGALYRGGAHVANISANNGVPTSGAISLGNFYNAQGSVFVDDQYDDYQQTFSTNPGETLTSTWIPRIVSRPWRARWSMSGAGATVAGGTQAQNTWLDRNANQGMLVQFTTTNGSSGGSVIRSGTITFDYAFPGQTTPFFSHTLSWTHEYGLNA